MRLASSIAAAAAALIVGLPALTPVASAGGGGGLQLGSEVDSEAHTGKGSLVLGLWGRLGLALEGRLSGQLALQLVRTTAERSSLSSVYNATALGVFDILDQGRLIPTTFVGGGLGRIAYYEGGTRYTTEHVEAGLGLEYRMDSGFCFGADARIGYRWVDYDPMDSYLNLTAGLYRVMRVTAGVLF